MNRLPSFVFHPLAILALTALACHALLPFTDYICYDDLWLTNWAVHGDYDHMKTIYSESGKVTVYWYFRLLSAFGFDPAACKLFGIVLSFGCGCLVYAIAARTRFVTRLDALFLGMVTIAFPAYKLIGGFVYSNYEFSYFVFLLAAFLVLRAEEWTGLCHWLGRLGGLLLFAMSFNLASLLMFYGGFFLLAVLLYQQRKGLAFYNVPLGYICRRLDMLLLPFVYWIAKNMLEPTHDHYADYNQPKLSLKTLLELYKTVPSVLTDPFALIAALSLKKKLALLGVVIPIVVYIVSLAARRVREADAAGDIDDRNRVSGSCRLRRAAGLLGFGLVLFVLGSAPYIAVNKGFGPFGVASTHTILLPLPIAIVLLAVGSAVPHRSTGWLPRALSGLLSASVAFCLVAWATSWWHNCLSLQALKVRNDSIMRYVHNNPAARSCSVFFVQNRLRIPRTPDDIHTWTWTYLECGLDGEPRSIAFNGLPLTSSGQTYSTSVEDVVKYIDETTLAYAMTSINPNGPKGMLLIRQGPGFRTSASAALKYLYFRHFAPDRMGPFLDSVTEAKFFPAPWDGSRPFSMGPDGKWDDPE
ncbi:MAG: hypothetical protein U0793_20890 [Gemmataceae bacterium]